MDDRAGIFKNIYGKIEEAAVSTNQKIPKISRKRRKSTPGIVKVLQILRQEPQSSE